MGEAEPAGHAPDSEASGKILQQGEKSQERERVSKVEQVAFVLHKAYTSDTLKSCQAKNSHWIASSTSFLQAFFIWTQS